MKFHLYNYAYSYLFHIEFENYDIISCAAIFVNSSGYEMFLHTVIVN